jgi:acetyl esterase/lipase
MKIQTSIEDESVLNRAASAADLVLRYGSDPDQSIQMRNGAGSAARQPLLMLIHGGFWRPSYDCNHMSSMAVALAKSGWTVANVEYRRIPGNPQLMLDDVGGALEILARSAAHHNGRIVVVGFSAGGHLALWLASCSRSTDLQSVLALAPVADLQLARSLDLGNGAVATMLGTQLGELARLDPCQLPPPRIGTRIVHGEEDAVVPITVSESYRATHPEAQLRRLSGTGHFALIDPLGPVWTEVTGQLQQLSAP